MATLREVRRRIAGVKQTQKITKAMKMVAAAKLRRAQTAVVEARPYARAIRTLLEHLVPVVQGAGGDLLVARPVNRLALVVVTSDRGLCGAFNANLVKASLSHLAVNYPGWVEQGKVTFVCVGRKGFDVLLRRRVDISEKYLGIFGHLTFAEAQRVARMLVDGFRNGRFDRVEIVYNEFKSISQQNIVIEQFLPVRPAEEASTRHAPAEPIYEPGKMEILQALLPKHLHFQIWRVLLESNAAEQGARMTAMDNATENARELIDVLQLQYNKARQASITKELLEIVGGAEALTERG